LHSLKRSGWAGPRQTEPFSVHTLPTACAWVLSRPPLRRTPRTRRVTAPAAGAKHRHGPAPAPPRRRTGLVSRRGPPRRRGRASTPSHPARRMPVLSSWAAVQTAAAATARHRQRTWPLAGAPRACAPAPAGGPGRRPPEGGQACSRAAWRSWGAPLWVWVEGCVRAGRSHGRCAGQTPSHTAQRKKVRLAGGRVCHASKTRKHAPSLLFRLFFFPCNIHHTHAGVRPLCPPDGGAACDPLHWR